MLGKSHFVSTTKVPEMGENLVKVLLRHLVCRIKIAFFRNWKRSPCLLVRRGQWRPTPVLLPRKSHGRRSRVGCSPWGRWESDTTERLHFHFSLSCIGEGNGNPLQCSCQENPRDGGAWWAAVYGVAQSRTRLKRLSGSSSLLVGLPGSASRKPIAQLVKNPPAMQETPVGFLGREDPLEKGKAAHSSILAWRIPWTV